MFDLSQIALPNGGNTDLVTFAIKVEGVPIPGKFEVQRIIVYRAVNKIAYAKIQILDGYVDQRRFPISDENAFSPGQSIEIFAGYHNENKPVFKGIIAKHGIHIWRKRSCVMEIECRDEAVKMTLVRRNKYFENQNDSDIIQAITAGYEGISVSNIQQTEVLHPHMVQHHVTDWDFILTRAEANGMLVIASDGKIEVSKPVFDQEPALELAFGSTIEEFEGEMDARDQYPAVKTSSWDYSQQQVIEQEEFQEGSAGLGALQAPDTRLAAASNGGFGQPRIPPNTDHRKALDVESLLMQHSGNRSDIELRVWAEAQLIKSQLAKRRGRVRFEGEPNIQLGQIIALQGLGDRFNEQVYVTAIRHEISSGKWTTDAQFGLPAQWFAESRDILAPPASGLLPGIRGLHIGVVTKIDSDPAAEDRVRVRLPLMGNDEDGLWARIACLDAGDKRGSFFRPYVGDEVIVGFLNDDARDPVILGMMNSSAKPAPFQATEDNFEKGFVTKEQLQIRFHEGDKSITLSTPSGKKITLDEKQGLIELQDENNNKMTLDSEGITIDAVSTLTLKAGSKIKLEAPDVSISAASNFSAASQGYAELKGQSQTVIKGGIVNIN